MNIFGFCWILDLTSSTIYLLSNFLLNSMDNFIITETIDHLRVVITIKLLVYIHEEKEEEKTFTRAQIFPAICLRIR